MTRQGTAHARFTRAIKRGHLFAAERAARELGTLSVSEALSLVLLYEREGIRGSSGPSGDGSGVHERSTDSAMRRSSSYAPRPVPSGRRSTISDSTCSSRRVGNGYFRLRRLDRKSTRLNSSHVKISY